jgi:hypothetical protein
MESNAMLSTAVYCVLLFAAALFAGGCSSTGGQLGTLQTQNRSLLEQNRAQLAEIENLKTHARRLEDKLIDAEALLAKHDRRDEPDRQRLANGDRELQSSMFDPSDDGREGGGAGSAGIRSDRLR